MYDIRDHVIWRTPASEKECAVSCKEGNFLLSDAEVVVYRKQEFHRMHPKNIGDGMRIPLHYPAHNFVHGDLPIHALESGLCAYKEYDEESDVWSTYLYKYAAGEEGREKIQRYLKQIGSNGVLIVEKGFTRIEWMATNTTLDMYVSFQEKLAYMIGICLWYGKPKQIGDDRLMSWHIWLPLIWSLGHIYPSLEQLRDELAREGIFLVTSVQKQQVGSLVQISIHDEWVLDILESIRFGQHASVSRYEQLTDKLLSFLWDEKGILDNSVLKFVSK